MNQKKGGRKKMIELDCSRRRESTLDRLERRKKQLEEELIDVNKAIELFEKHTEIPDALDLLARITF
jgi:hypothetical protein